MKLLYTDKHIKKQLKMVVQDQSQQQIQ